VFFALHKTSPTKTILHLLCSHSVDILVVQQAHQLYAIVAWLHGLNKITLLNFGTRVKLKEG
jgi:hypothetical protein